MTSLPQLASTLHTLLGQSAERLARSSGFLQRRRCLSGASFAQALVCGWLAAPAGPLSHLAQALASAGTPVSRQALHQRFTPAAARFLRALLQEAVGHVVSGAGVAVPLLQRFTTVMVLDSTTIVLPAVLVDHWQGCGNAQGQGAAALKVQARMDLRRGTLETLALQAGRGSDRTAARSMAPLPPGSLQLADLGYFSVKALAAIVDQGSHFLSRLLTQTALFTPAGTRLPLTALLGTTRGRTVEQPILLGGQGRLPCRLLRQRLSDQQAAQRFARQQEQAKAQGEPLPREARALSHWLLLVTSVPAAQLSLDEAFVLYRLRWQVELLFKRWKSLGQVDVWRTQKPDRILCEVYAKLLGTVVLHWLVVRAGWQRADKSLWAATQAIQRHAFTLLNSLQHGPARLVELLRMLATVLTTCRISAQASRPYAHQRALAVAPRP